MFVIHQSPDKVRNALLKLRTRFEGLVPCGPVRLEELGDKYLGWFSCRPTDNVHMYTDGFLVGTLSFDEAASSDLQEHSNRLPESPDPLLGAIKIYKNGVIEPIGIANAYYSTSAVSDMQLLIADLEGFLPSPMEFAVLTRVGYFPGNLTLFDEVKRIPFLAQYDLSRGSAQAPRLLQVHEPDDKAMIRRLVEIVPQTSWPQFLALSGGIDSRFVLGVLLSAGIRPTLLHGGRTEDDIVRSIAQTLDLRLFWSGNAETVPPISLSHPVPYTAMTDAQIVFRSGKFSMWRRCFPRDSILHVGLFADSSIKNAFKTAWKVPDPRSKLLDRLIHYALLQANVSKAGHLKSFENKCDVTEYLAEHLAYQEHYLEVRGSKSLANWFYYINRGIRWSSASLCEASYFTRPLFILSDLEATLYGLFADSWSNYAHSRARTLNRELLPAVDAPYANGLRSLPDARLLSVLERVGYEYFNRALAYVRDQREVRVDTSLESNVEAIPLARGDLLAPYLTKSPEEVFLDRAVPDRAKRAIITLSHVLDYLQSTVL